MISFNNKILIIGFGTIGQALIPIILKNIDCDIKNITVLEDGNNQKVFDENYTDYPKYVNITMNEENAEELLNRFCGQNGFVANMGTTIESTTVMKWCMENNALYVDTGHGFWPDREAIEDMKDRTCYVFQEEIRKWSDSITGATPTAIISHGANPGMINHFVKKGLIDLVDALGLEYKTPTTREEWALLMQRSGTKVIHCSERDTQVSYIPKEVDEFVCTWSVHGMFNEGTLYYAEMGWGTHETWMPEKMRKHEDPNAYATYMEQAGFKTLARSWLPIGGQIQGYILPHRETVSLPSYFTVWENGVPIYRPTVHYVYMPCNDTLASAFECTGTGFKRQSKSRILNNDIVSGIDELGALLMGHPLNSWWCGSQLSIEETRTIVKDQSATTLQVIAGVISAMLWAIKNPNGGYREPDELPYDEILEYANPYLGPVYSGASDWTPLKSRSPLYPNDAKDEENLWSFKNFYID